jgi:two-component system, OmpR family, phosphate regulon sensor histidine kinase PhoR
MLAAVDLTAGTIIAVLVIALAIASLIARDRGRALRAARAAALRPGTGGPHPADTADAADAAAAGSDRRFVTEVPAGASDLPEIVRRLRDRVETSEHELDQQVRNASYFADLMGVGILRLDENGRIELANAAAHVLLGRPPRWLRGKTTLEAFVDARVEELILDARASGAASGEFRFSGPEGRILVVRARRSPLPGLWVVLEDVSELRRLQQIRTEFVDNLSHELRTPLSTISLLAETLARDAEAAGEGVPPKMRDRIAKIEVETGHLVQMVNELLDLARIEGGGPPVLMDDVDLGRIALEAADRLRLFAERQGLRIVVDVPAAVPAVRGDEARLGQVVVNLVHNALKFGRPDDGERPSGDGTEGEDRTADEVRVTVTAGDDDVSLSVEDHGVGIPKADQARIFERFYKVDRVRVRGGGTGLGLAIARHVIQQHGGRIRVESEEGRGSTFTVTLPVAPRDGVAAA